jgi:hypothetical protein
METSQMGIARMEQSVRYGNFEKRKSALGVSAYGIWPPEGWDRVGQALSPASED